MGGGDAVAWFACLLKVAENGGPSERVQRSASSKRRRLGRGRSSSNDYWYRKAAIAKEGHRQWALLGRGIRHGAHKKNYRVT